MSKISNFKNNLGRVFDDNLHTKVWHNVIDYVIIGLIIISTIEVFLSTYESIAQRYGKWLYWVDHLTTYIFTIEIILRMQTLYRPNSKVFGDVLDIVLHSTGSSTFCLRSRSISTLSYHYPLPHSKLYVLHV